jgi:hypothetical protein
MAAPHLVMSNRSGDIFEHPDLFMAGMSLRAPVIPEDRDLIPLPEGSDLFSLPGRVAVGYDPAAGEFVEVTSYRGEPVTPVAAFMAPAHLQLYRSAFRRLPGSPRLPLYSYTAVGWKNGGFSACGMRIDADTRQDLHHVDLDAINARAQEIRKRASGNRLVRHLVDNCVLRYGCPAARNFVMGRWECPLPASPYCNAGCIGCISCQPDDSGVKASQERIRFIPEVGEILEVAVPHLEHAPRPVVSFGQGCEGEPLLVGELIEECISGIRKKTPAGVINLNTNGSRPDIVERLCEAGLDSIRVSVNSAQERYFNAYHQPRGYGLDQVVETLRTVRGFSLWSSLNYFMFPGLTDYPSEIAALEGLVRGTRVNMIQTRNLNMDPDWYIDELELDEPVPPVLGMRRWIERVTERLPWVKLGYFNPPREEMNPRHFRFD